MEALKAPWVPKIIRIVPHRPWAYFDGACRNKDAIMGLGFFLFLLGDHEFWFKTNAGQGTNNQSEFNSLYYLLKYGLNFSIIGLQVKGESQITISRLNNEVQVENICLQNLAQVLLLLKIHLQQIDFHNMLREKNIEGGLELRENLCWWKHRYMHVIFILHNRYHDVNIGIYENNRHI